MTKKAKPPRAACVSHIPLGAILDLSRRPVQPVGSESSQLGQSGTDALGRREKSISQIRLDLNLRSPAPCRYLRGTGVRD